MAWIYSPKRNLVNIKLDMWGSFIPFQFQDQNRLQKCEVLQHSYTQRSSKPVLHLTSHSKCLFFLTHCQLIKNPTFSTIKLWKGEAARIFPLYLEGPLCAGLDPALPQLDASYHILKWETWWNQNCHISCLGFSSTSKAIKCCHVNTDTLTATQQESLSRAPCHLTHGDWKR